MAGIIPDPTALTRLPGLKSTTNSMKIEYETDKMGESEQCGNTALAHISDLSGGHQLPDQNSTTRLVPLLHSDKCAIVDAVDYELIMQRQWRARKFSKGYTLYAMSLTLLMHRVITGTPKGLEVDHIDGNGLNNSRSNLRIVTRSLNGLNKKMQSNNTSGHRGVSWDKINKRWTASAQKEGKTIRFGRFKDKADAIKAVEHGAKQLFGEFYITRPS